MVGEVGVSEGFQLHRSRVQVMLAEAAGDLFGEMREGGFEVVAVLRVGVESVFVADGFGVAAFADVGIEPAASRRVHRALPERARGPICRSGIRGCFRRRTARSANAARMPSRWKILLR